MFKNYFIAVLALILSSSAMARQSMCRIQTLTRKIDRSNVEYSGLVNGKRLFVSHLNTKEMGDEYLTINVNGKTCNGPDLKKTGLADVNEINVLSGKNGAMKLALITQKSEASDMLLIPVVGNSCGASVSVRAVDNNVDLLSIASEPSEGFDGTRVPLVVARTFPDSDGSGKQVMTVGAFDDECNSDNGFSRK